MLVLDWSLFIRGGLGTIDKFQCFEISGPRSRKTVNGAGWHKTFPKENGNMKTPEVSVSEKRKLSHNNSYGRFESERNLSATISHLCGILCSGYRADSKRSFITYYSALLSDIYYKHFPCCSIFSPLTF